MGPPDNILGAPVALDSILARGPGHLAIALTGFTAWPVGIAFTLALRRREAFDDDGWLALLRRVSGPSSQVDTSSPPGAHVGRQGLTIKLLLADGTELDLTSEPQGERQSGRWQLGRLALDADSWQLNCRLWLSPLPPKGPTMAHCEWPSNGVPKTITELDWTPIIDSVERAIVLWEE
jgi:hypothetical protein